MTDPINNPTSMVDDDEIDLRAQIRMAEAGSSRESADHKAKTIKSLVGLVTTLATDYGHLLFVFLRQALRNSAQTKSQPAKCKPFIEIWI